MSAGYQLRLLLQCLNTAFFVHLLFSFCIALLAQRIIYLADRMRPAAGARLLFLFRLLPLAAALYAALTITLPSYVRLETNRASELVGPGAILLSICAVLVIVRPVVRSAIALFNSLALVNRVKRHAQPTALSSEKIWISSDSIPRVAVAGLLRSRVVMSRAALGLFSAEQLEMVLRHEKAHQRSGDNLRRLFWLLLPDAIPFFSFAASLEQAYKRLIEWAADDFASAGDTRKSTALAAALVAFTRYQTRASNCALVTFLGDDSAALRRRVDRLLNHRCNRVSEAAIAPWLALATAGVVCLTAGHFANLLDVHELLEFLSH